MNVQKLRNLDLHVSRRYQSAHEKVIFMSAPDAYFSFFMASLAFAYMPGPALVYAATQTIAGGRRAGLMAAIGIHIGGYSHVLAVALGVATIIETSPQIFTAIKTVGVCYLIWLGVRLLLTQKDTPDSASGYPNNLFWQSVTVEVFNPTTAIFFLAFLPQFIDFGSGLPVWVQLVILGAVVNAIFSSVELLCVVFASQVMRMYCFGKGQSQSLRRLGGVFLIAISLNLALAEN